MAMCRQEHLCLLVFLFIVHSAKDARFVDIDGNEWMDFMCGFGAILHGYLHPRIEEAVLQQRSLGSIFNQPSTHMVELAELLVARIDFADWAVFAKNGSDLTSWAIRVAREKTGREYVIKARGCLSWCRLLVRSRNWAHFFRSYAYSRV